ncbi:MAG: 30S ribosomal protein S16 [Candidatus Komeilibacteria bacterium]
MLTIRLSRIGKKKKPFYRLIVSEKTKDPWGTFLEQLGHFNPHTKQTVLKTDRIKYWISVGAQMSNTVSNLLVKEGVIKDKKKKSVYISKNRHAKIEKAKPQPQPEAVKGKADEKPVESAPVAEEKPEPKKEAKVEEVKTEEPKAEETKE